MLADIQAKLTVVEGKITSLTSSVAANKAAFDGVVAQLTALKNSGSVTDPAVLAELDDIATKAQAQIDAINATTTADGSPA